jgi:hypothetical protein
MGVKQISPGGAVSALATVLGRSIEIRLLIGGLNDGDAIPSPAAGFPGWSRFQSVLGTTNYVAMLSTTGGTTVQARTLDGRRSAQWFGLAGNNSVWVLRPGGGTAWYLDFGGPGFQPLSIALQGALPTPQFGWATDVMAWCRKLNAIDGSSCRMGLGFANNTVVSPSSPIPRVGLLGDGAGGYRYGSVNCPDGALGGPNGDGDIDAGSQQPGDIVNPGTSWWHSRFRMVPALPNQGARIACYHSGKRVALFTGAANFPRGHQTTNDNYSRIEATIWNFSGDVAALHVPELCLWDVRFYLHDDYTV